MFVIGTAGHIDHGKSLLIQKLTGIDPDRLSEEKERGMTIDLGFAWLKLPSGNEVGIVDVPGHERFIKNMLAGVGGIDMALLIVAANEGVMPQTREHLAILDLLDIKTGIVVITKIDLVDEELLNLVKIEVDDLINSTTLAKAPIVEVSAFTGEGLTTLISRIDELLLTIESRKDIGRPRLLIDRVFTISGSGTVVTGTLIDGILSVGEEVEVIPPGIKTRLRGLQTHKARIEEALPGSRVAANIVGVNQSQLERGDVLTRSGWLLPSRRVDVKLSLLKDIKHPLRHGATVAFYVGASEVMAKVHLLEGDKLGPGDSMLAQFSLIRPVAIVKGDHFIIRSSKDTLGGGIIVHPHVRRHRRFKQDIIHDLSTIKDGTVADMVVAMLAMRQPLEFKYLLVDCNLSAEEAEKSLDILIMQNKIVMIGEGNNITIYSIAGWDYLTRKATSVMQDYYRKFTARAGAPKGELSSKLGLSPRSPVLQKLFSDGILIEDGALVKLPSYEVKLTERQQTDVDNFLTALSQNPFSPPGDLVIEPDLVTLLVKQQKVVKVNEGIVFSKAAYDEMVDKILSHARANGKITLAEVRDIFSTSRKYAKALLEYMDEKKLTRRVGDERVVR